MSKQEKRVPELRFKGYVEEWEQRKFVDNVEEILDYRGKTPTKFGMEWGNQGYLVLSALNVKDGYIDKSVEAKYGDQKLFEMWMGERRLEKGDILFTTEAPLGNVAQIPDDEDYILNQRTVAFKTNSRKTNRDFLAQLLRSPHVQERLNANASGGTAKGIGMKEFSKLTTYVSTQVEEQEEIGKLFSHLDYLIALHQQKLDKLKLLKKGLMQQLFPDPHKKIPRLRFANFDGVWKQRKLEEVTERVSGNDGRMNLPTLTISAGKGWLDQRERFTANIAGKEQKNYTLLTKGELSYNKGNSKLAKYGVVFELTSYNEALVPRVYHSFKTNNLALPCFIEQMFFTKKPDQELAKLITSGARMDGLLNIGFEDFMGIKVKMPNVSEQRVIASFLRSLEINITLHHSRIDKLYSLKRSFLKKMFI